MTAKEIIAYMYKLTGENLHTGASVPRRAQILAKAEKTLQKLEQVTQTVSKPEKVKATNPKKVKTAVPKSTVVKAVKSKKQSPKECITTNMLKEETKLTVDVTNKTAKELITTYKLKMSLQSAKVRVIAKLKQAGYDIRNDK
jgi:hypothetical protein